MAISIWWSLFFWSYIFYPICMKWMAGRRNMPKYSFFEKDEVLPDVSIIMAVHNEEKVLSEKFESILKSQYDLSKIHIYIGLDHCNDNSIEIVKKYKNIFPHLSFVETDRKGKPQMLNFLFEIFRPTTAVSIFTDANVYFTENTIYELVKYFKSEQIGLVDSKYLLGSEIVSHQLEKEYLNFEQQLKFHEGEVAGVMQGPFGGCFAIRTSLYIPIPENYLVDDFFIGMSAMVQGYEAILNPKAVVIEEVHTSWREEYLRKKRISSGNFQNLSHFSYVLRKPFTALSIAWVSHKVLRWVLPLCILPAIFIGYVEFLCFGTGFWASTITLILILSIVFALYILQRLNLHSKTIERLSYFIYINLALVQGFIIYFKGIKSNVWKPTQRK